MMRSLNDTLSDIYNDDAIAMADVAKQFSLYNNGTASTPSAVARTCALTWMCPRGNSKANIHPDDAGYLEIAEAIDAVMPPNL